MRALVLMRGTPSSGKSTWIEKNGLKDYTLSADDIRLLYRSKIIDVNGKENIDQSINKQAWKTLFEILEERMKVGEFTVIDACNSKTTEMNQYKALAEKYRYRMYCVDFTDVPIEQAKEWNRQRPEFKRVNESVIDLYYSRFQTQQIPSGIKVVKKDEALDTILYKNIDLSNYKNIYVIGDVHGCYTALKTLLNDAIDTENYYIFLGDYIDRGIENKEVLELLIRLKDCENVVLLEGNHEIHLWNYANDEIVKSKEFMLNTINQIRDISKKDLRQLYRKLRQCIFFSYYGQYYFCCHAGISAIKGNPIFIPTNKFIKGTGDYSDIYECQNTFARLNPETIQIHGHRNPNNVAELKQSDNCYNLESRVEFGGYLSTVKINKDGIEEIKIKNNVFKEEEKEDIDNSMVNTENIDVANIVMKLRSNPKYIIEKKFDNISSFNFSRRAFNDKVWDDITTKARGLFINTDNYTIATRGYEKFFNIGEVKETEMSYLSTHLKFPVDCYVKYNGFLGLLGYDEKNDKLLFCSKSNIGGEFSQYFEKIFMDKYANKYNEILDFIKVNNVSFVFEVIDIEHDPHIIEYKESDIVLLDIIKREVKFFKFKYSDLVNIAQKFGLKAKEKAYTINSWPDFIEWNNTVLDKSYLYQGKEIEGFVIEDQNGFMTKLKLYYYKFWKFMRSVKDEVFRLSANGNYKGYINKTSSLTTPEMNLFYGFIKNLAENKYNGETDIISLRKLFERNKDNGNT